jgi:hypothetical protein
MSSANGIKVVARFRPQNKVELASGGTPIVSFDGDETCILDVCCPFALLFLSRGKQHTVRLHG